MGNNAILRMDDQEGDLPWNMLLLWDVGYVKVYIVPVLGEQNSFPLDLSWTF